MWSTFSCSKFEWQKRFRAHSLTLSSWFIYLLIYLLLPVCAIRSTSSRLNSMTIQVFNKTQSSMVNTIILANSYLKCQLLLKTNSMAQGFCLSKIIKIDRFLTDTFKIQLWTFFWNTVFLCIYGVRWHHYFYCNYCSCYDTIL